MSRQDYVVRIHELTPPQYVLLSRLLTGSTLAELAEQTDPAAFIAASRLSLEEWAAKGLFQRFAK
jgi:hypothetical protein